MKEDILTYDIRLIGSNLETLRILYADRYTHLVDRAYLVEGGIVDERTLDLLVTEKIVRDMGDYYSLPKDLSSFFNSRLGVSVDVSERDWENALEGLKGRVGDLKRLYGAAARRTEIAEATNHVLDEMVDLEEDIEDAIQGIRNDREFTYKNERLFEAKIRRLELLNETTRRLGLFQQKLLGFMDDEREFLQSLMNPTLDKKAEALRSRALSMHGELMGTNATLLEYISRSERSNTSARILSKVSVLVRNGMFEQDESLRALLLHRGDKPLDRTRNARRKMPSLKTLSTDDRMEGILDSLPGKLSKISREHTPPSPIPPHSLRPAPERTEHFVDYDTIYNEFLGSGKDLYVFLKHYPFPFDMDIFRRGAIFVNLLDRHQEELAIEGIGSDEHFRYEVALPLERG